ncbi:MAG TPA: hypothetical protein VGM03_06410, partial [Phycisphaerae bacterium]
EEVLRNIRETPPTSPSRAWRADSGVTGRSARKLRPSQCPIDDEIETIALKCLAKERERRYQSAGELGKDLAHYLADEPIEARRDSGWYVLKKTLRRYRVPATVAAAFVLIVLIGFVVSTAALQRARIAEAEQRRERTRAEDEATRATAAAQREAEARRDAEQKAEALRRRDYINSIALAQQAYESNNMRQLRELLARCPDDLRNWEWRRLDWLAKRGVVLLPRGATSGSVVAIPDDGRWALRGEGSLSIRDVENGEVRCKLSGSAALPVSTRNCAVSADGRYAAVAIDTSVRLWNAETGRELPAIALPGIKFGQIQIALSPDGARLACVTREISAWNVATGDKLWSVPVGLLARWLFDQYPPPVAAIAWSPDGGALAVALGNRVVVLDTVSGRPRTAQNSPDVVSFGGPVACIIFSPDGSMLIGGRADGDIEIWSYGQRRLSAHRNAHVGAVNCLLRLPRSDRILSGGQDATVRVWDSRNLAELQHFRGDRPVTDLGVTSDERRVLSVAGARLAAWDLEAEPAVRALALNPGDWTASGSANWLVRFQMSSDMMGADFHTLRLETGEPHHVRLACAFQLIPWPTRPAVNGSARRAVAILNGSDSHGEIIAVDVGAGAVLQRHQLGEKSSRTNVCISQDGNWIAWDSPSDRIITVSQVGSSDVREIDVQRHPGRFSLSPDGGQLAVAHSSDSLSLWDCKTATMSRSIVTSAGFGCLSYSPDARSIVAGDAVGRITILAVDSGDERLSWDAHSQPVNAVAFSPDGTRLVSVGADRSVIVWDAATGAHLLTLEGRSHSVESLAFGENRIVAVGEEQATTWETRDASEQDLVIRRASKLVDALFDEVVLRQDVLDRLAGNPAVDNDVRAAALRLAESRVDNLGVLINSAWDVVKAPGGDADVYARALRHAAAAARMGPVGRPMLILGVAQYRNGQNAEALATLRWSDSTTAFAFAARGNKAGDPAPPMDALFSSNLPVHGAFIAMSLHNLGRTDEAQRVLARLRALMKDPAHANRVESLGFLREAEALIESDKAGDGN